MNKEHTKGASRPSKGVPKCSKCTFRPCSWSQSSGELSLSPPQASVNRGPLTNHRQLPKQPAYASARSRDVSGTGGLHRYLVRASANQHSTPEGGGLAHADSKSLSARKAGGHSLKEERREVAWCASYRHSQERELNRLVTSGASQNEARKDFIQPPFKCID